MPHTHAPESKPAQKKSAGAPCSCPQPPPPQTCCELICFERPNYFCGHLLTDEDLKLEQRYLREKLKLYHRTLHGHGVVCGLRLSCHRECPGHIRVGTGFAIDDCGNDLVVCKPLTFDVIGRLREKHLLVEEPEADRCAKPEPKREKCEVRQCFHIVLCYDEEESDFTAPLLSGCRPQLNGCEPTRIRETVRLDVVAELPPDPDPLDQIRARLAKCTDVFTKGEFAQAFKENADAISALMDDKPKRGVDYRDLYCRLRGLILLYLRHHCDPGLCDLELEIAEIPIPPKEGRDTKDRDEGKKGHESVEVRETKDSFCRLLEVISQHVISCSLNAMIPVCSEPCAASCVALGTVEVEHGKIVRVCNCPRSYVWSFAHFFEVLLGTVIGGLGCEARHDHEDAEMQDGSSSICCREFKIPDCKALVQSLADNEDTWGLRSLAPLRTIQALQQSLRHAFDLTRVRAIPPDFIKGKTVEQANAAARHNKIELAVQDENPIETPLPPVEALMAFTLKDPGQAFIAYQKQGLISSVVPDLRPIAKLDRHEREALERRINEASQKQNEEFKALSDRIKRLEERLNNPQESGPGPEGGGGTGGESEPDGNLPPEAGEGSEGRGRKKK